MTAALVAGLLAGYGIALPIGAVGAYLVTLSARAGARVAAGAALGVASADGLYALVAVVVGRGAARRIEPISGSLRVISAVVLLLVAARIAWSAVRDHESTPPAPPRVGRAYLSLLAITLLNPTTVVYFTALVLGGRSAAIVSPGSSAVFVLAAFGASASWQLLLAGSGSLLGRWFAGPRGRRLTGLGSSVVITALAIRLLR